MSLKVLKADPSQPDKQIVYGEVYAPDRPDAQGEFMRAPEIEKMAHDFLRSKKIDQVDVMHNNSLVKCNVVESFIARDGDPDFIPGSWVIGMHVDDPVLWGKIKKGELNGFSMEAFVSRHDHEGDVELPPVVQGHTSKSDDGHSHTFYVSYDDNAKFLGGTTDYVNGHKHEIVAGTHTEEANGHTHRFSSVDNLHIV